MPRENSKRSRALLVRIAGSVVIAALLAGCAPGTPFIRKQPASVKSHVMVTLSSDKGKLKKQCTVAWAKPGLCRIEVRGFLNEPLFALSASGEDLKMYLYQSNLYYEEKVRDAGPELCRLFAGELTERFELKFNSKPYTFSVGYGEISEDTGLPKKIILSNGRGSASIDYISPDTAFAHDNDFFNVKVPKNAVKVNEEAIIRSLDTWIN